MTLNPELRAILQKENRRNPGSIIVGSELRQPVRETITTGSLSFDAALGGGWATGHWHEIVGWESSGKTWLALQTIRANQKRNPNFTTLWVATEDFHEPYADMWGVDRERVIIQKGILMEDILQVVLDFIDTKAVDLVVIDSLVGLVPEREDENDMDAFQPGVKAILTGKFFRKCQKSIRRALDDIDERPCTGLLINQWRFKIGSYGDPLSTPGGVEKNFWMFSRVDVKRTAWIKNTKDLPIGQTVKLTAIKNKYAPPRRHGEVDIHFANGGGFKAGQIDYLKDIVSAALAYETIQKDGAKYQFGEQSWHGRPRLEKALVDDPKLRGKVKQATLHAATKPLPAPKQSHTVRRSGGKG